MNLSLVICTYNRAESLRVVLDSLAQVRVPPGVTWEVIVVDNNSPDTTRAVVEGVPPAVPCRYLFEGRQGKSFALNTAIAQATGDIVAFTDDDVTVDPGWLTGVCQAFADPACTAIGGRIVPVWSQPKPSWYVETGPYRMMGVLVRYEHGDRTIPAPWLPFGANMAFRRSVFATYGSFNTDLGPFGNRVVLGEDSEFCQRLRVGGEMILYVPDALIYHPVPPARAKKAYFLRWYYLFGRYDPLREPFPAGAIRWFGVPRYLFRNLLEEALRWLTTVHPQHRFFHKLVCYRYVGRIVEAYQTARRAP